VNLYRMGLVVAQQVDQPSLHVVPFGIIVVSEHAIADHNEVQNRIDRARIGDGSPQLGGALSDGGQKALAINSIGPPNSLGASFPITLRQVRQVVQRIIRRQGVVWWDNTLADPGRDLPGSARLGGFAVAVGSVPFVA